MSDPVDVRLVLEEAERAAAAGDYRTAELFLRDAAARQEDSLGPFHPDLANTLNNLAVVYETLEQPSKAERCYRRAYAITLAAFEPNHPFVAISEKNYRDFCDARGIPFEPPRPLPPVPGPSEDSLSFVETLNIEEPRGSREPSVPKEPLASEKPLSSQEPLRSTEPPRSEESLRSMERVSSAAPVRLPEPAAHQEPRSSTEPSRTPEPDRSEKSVGSVDRRRAAPVVWAVAGLVALIAAALWFRADDGREGAQTAQSAASDVARSQPEIANPPREPESKPATEPAAIAVETLAPAAPSPARKSERPIESAGGRRTSPPPKPAAPVKPSTSAVAAKLAVEDATVCRELRNWRCSEAGRSVDSGNVFFYTRIKSATPLTIEHRWYRNDRLQRTVPIRIQPNDQNGFRAFSRTAVKPGDWRVELRTRDGAVLRTENFSVR
jgi:hypothetical protein